jgi:hypothetical protein
MFSWLKRMFKHECQIHVNIHVDGNLLVKYDRQGLSEMVGEGLKNDNVANETKKLVEQGTDKIVEQDISSSFFADTQTPEVDFGNEIELPPKRD